jgi:glycosyltransferase involved in cell wall biosynthesis
LKKADIKVLQVLGREPVGGVGTFITNTAETEASLKFDFIESPSNVESIFNQRMKEKGSQVFWAPKLGFTHAVSYWIWTQKFYKVNASKYDVIHVETPVVALPHLLLAKKYGVKVRIYHAHNTVHPNKIKNIRNKLLVKIAVKFATNRFAAGNKAGVFNYGSNEFACVKNGIDTRMFSFDKIKREQTRKRLKINEKKVFIQVGTVDARKNQQLIIDAMSLIPKEILKNISVLFVGNGPSLKELQKQIYDKDLGENAICLGNVELGVEKYYSAADVFLMPSISEGFPLTAIEAQCNGLQCLISKNVDPEIAIVPENVKFVEVDSDEAASVWANRMIESGKLTDDGLDTRIYRERQVFKKGYEKSQMGHVVYGLYKKALKDNS